MMSYSDHNLSVLRHASCVVNNWLVNTLDAHILAQSLTNLPVVRMFTSMKAWMSSKPGLMVSKSRSLGQIIEKPYEHNRSHTLNPIFSELGHKVCLHESLDEFETGSQGVKIQVPQKPCKHSGSHNFSPIFTKLCQDVCLHTNLDEFNTGSCGLKKKVTRLNLRKTLLSLLGPYLWPKHGQKSFFIH